MTKSIVLLLKLTQHIEYENLWLVYCCHGWVSVSLVVTDKAAFEVRLSQ